MRTMILAAVAATLLAGSAVAQDAPRPDAIHPNDIDWSPWSGWGVGASYTMDITGTLDLTAATLTLTDLFDFDDFADAMSLDASTTITAGAGETFGIVVTDGTDNVFTLGPTGSPYLDLDLGATNILRLTSTAGLDCAFGNATGDVTITSDLFTVNASPIIRGVATGDTALSFRDFDTTDLETAVQMLVSATDTGTGTEDTDFSLAVREAGAALDIRFSIDGDGGIVLGSATNASVTLTTTGTGDTAVVLPLQSVAAGEILNDTITAVELADALSPEAGQTILGLGAMEIGVVDGAFNLTLQMGDAAGAQKVLWEDSADAEVASINSDGVATFAGGLTVSAGTVALPAGEVGAAEIADDAITGAQLADAISWETPGSILGDGAFEIGVADGAWNLTIQLGDAAGAQKVLFEDSADAEVASVNSDGVATFAGGLTVSAGTVALPAGEIGSAEIGADLTGANLTDDTLNFVDLADALSPEAGTAILGLGALEIGVVDGAFDLTIQLGDNAAAQKVAFQDSDDAEIASLNSNGILTLAGGLTVSAGTVALPAGEIDATELADAVTRTDLGQLTITHGLPISNWRVSTDLTALPTAGNGTSLGLVANAFATNVPWLAGSDSNNNSITETARLQVDVPRDIIAGGDITVTIQCRVSVLRFAGATIDLEAYQDNGAGAISAELAADAAVSVNTVAWTAASFSLTGVSSGRPLDIRITCVSDDTGGGSAGKIIVERVSFVYYGK